MKNVSETGVKSDPAFCLGPSIENTNGDLLTISPVSFFDAAIVGNILALGIDAIEVEPDLRDAVVPVLVDDTPCFAHKLLLGF